MQGHRPDKRKIPIDPVCTKNQIQIEPIWIRLRSHEYKTWDISHLDNLYVDWERAMEPRPLDGLIITGAPVEHLPFEKIKYWSEIVELINFLISDKTTYITGQTINISGGE